ncbi:ABC transporter ATP-binding protein/permease [Microbulbifer sp. OS29]|uniref:ABC transporter ATP-binding protein/permease n=1 Tax=Microbulbifer okhotskensis TaxID=2926617 RepID=A0A9X2J5Q6_9GAMM|nr:ABC transporter ATP-binding protein [Microbulbifer okhotskensis]MCO1335802.1 ABC transporter ATP-binding protein/permease [Microbulbifer okhotskensis]
MSTERAARLLQSICWPGTQLEAAVQNLSRKGKLISGKSNVVGHHSSQEKSVNERLYSTANILDVHVEQVRCNYDQLSIMLKRVSPALIRLEFDEDEFFLAICGTSSKHLHLLSPSLRVVKIPVREVIEQLVYEEAKPIRQRINTLFNNSGILLARREKAIRALLDENLASFYIDTCWILRQPTHKSVWDQLRHKGLLFRFITMLGCRGVQLCFFVMSWWLIGRAILGGYIDGGWLVAWILLVVTQVPISLITARLQGGISVEMGALLKRRLMASALHIAPGEVRHMGVGQVLSRVYDAESIEAGALQAGFRVILGILELFFAALVLFWGGGGLPYIVGLCFFSVTAVYFGRNLYFSRRDWTAQRITMTHSLVEKMIGHRTRLAQEKPEQWHRDEDGELSEYLQRSAAMDSQVVYLVTLLPRTWLLLGILGLIPAFVSGSGDNAALAVILGGVLLGYRAVGNSMSGFTAGLNALVAWERIRDIFKLETVNANGQSTKGQSVGLEAGAVPKDQPLCFLRDLSFVYSKKNKPVLNGCNLSIFPSDRVLLQGASGSGKSTLASILVGLKKPTDGLLLLNGYDSSSIGWGGVKKFVASAPQFHENHVMGDSFLFNLLMGGAWPPDKDSLLKAYKICDELGLSPLLEKMPAGMLQTVGEMGWRLSHGEKSRLFIARSLLQDSELVVLDESFAALDPESLNLAMECVRKYSKTLVVIAHP